MSKQSSSTVDFVEYTSIKRCVGHIVRSNLESTNREGLGFLNSNMEKLTYQMLHYLLTVKRDVFSSYKNSVVGSFVEFEKQECRYIEMLKYLDFEYPKQSQERIIHENVVKSQIKFH